MSESTRLVSTDSVREMELIQAVQKQDFKKVKVRRPLEAVLAPSMVRREAPVWGSASGMPSSLARFGLAVPNLPPVSGAAQAIVMLHAGAPPCRSRCQGP